MTCHTAREQLSALVDDALPAAERAALQAHLEACPHCARELDALARTVAALRGLGPARAPAGFVDRVLTATRPAPAARGGVRLLRPWPVMVAVPAAALVLVGGLAVLLFRGTVEQQRGVVPATAPALSDRVAPANRLPAAPDDRAASHDRAAPPAPAMPTAPAPAREATSAVAKEARARAEAQRAEQPAEAAPVTALLRATAPAGAASALVAAAVRLGGAERGRRADGGATLVEITVPGDRYADFVREASRLGDLRLEREPSPVPAQVVLAIRVVP